MSRRIALAFALACAASCGDSTAEFPRYELFRNLALAEELEVVLPASCIDARLRTLAATLRARDGRVVNFVDSASARGAGELPRIVIADPGTPGVRALLEALEIHVAPARASFGFVEQSYSGRDDCVVVTAPDPEREGLPVTLYFALDATRAASFVRDLTPSSRPAFRTYRDGVIEREARIASDGEIVPSAASDELIELARLPSKAVTFRQIDVVFHGPSDTPAVEECVRRLATTHEQLARAFAAQAPELAAPFNVHLWPSAAELALATGGWALACRGPAPLSAHMAVEPFDDGGAKSAEAWFCAAFGEPAHAWLAEGLGVHFARRHWGKHLTSEWLPYLAARGIVPDVDEIVSAESRLSPHVAAPMRAALFALLLERDGAGGVLELWRGERVLELPSQRDFASGLTRLTGGGDDELASSTRHDASRAPFRRGLHLVPERDDDGRAFLGLGTKACAASLRAARELGVNALALEPQSFIEEREPAWPGDARAEPFDTTTPDAALALACEQSLGMHALFAPQLLDSRSGTFAGWTLIENAADFERFFAVLEARTTHYALLAELCNAELFCVASELTQTTRMAEGAAATDYLLRAPERWREVIARARAAFRGALTYAAFGLTEARAVPFWDGLDYVGCNVYRSLALEPARDARPDDSAAAAALHGSFGALIELASEHGMQALVTDIGFPAASDAWREPARAVGTLDVEEQSRLVAATAEAVRRQAAGPATLAGIYLRGWSTDPNAGRVLARDFTLQNRPASAALGRFYGKR